MNESLFGQLHGAGKVASTGSATIFGVEVALVTNVQDPQKLGRVKVCFPRLSGMPESDWARVVQPAGGPGRGFYWLPEVNDEVLVAFEMGQPNRPFVLRALWNAKDKPMKDAYADDNSTRMIQTKSGHQIVLSDKDGEEKITICDGSGKRVLTFDVKAKKLLIEAKEGSVELKAKKKMVLRCEDLEIKSSKDAKIDVGSKFDLKVASDGAMKAGGTFTLKGSKVHLNPSSLSVAALAGAVAGAAAGAATGGAKGAVAGAQAGAAAGAGAGSPAAGAGAGASAGAAGGATVATQDVVEQPPAPRAAAPGGAAAAASGGGGAPAPQSTSGKGGAPAATDASQPQAGSGAAKPQDGSATAKPESGSSAAKPQGANGAPQQAGSSDEELPEETPPQQGASAPAKPKEETQPQPAAGGDQPELSGPKWVKRFPTSRSLDDLEAGFQKKAKAFIDALQDAGASVDINATLRPKERAFLMHWSYHVAKGLKSAKKVPKMDGVDINWDHGDDAKSRKAAQQMVDAYDIVHEPALASRHTEGKAIDMDIAWTGTLKIKKADGTEVSISTTPRTGADNESLHAVGKSYGVIKLTTDAPHWSSDGH